MVSEATKKEEHKIDMRSRSSADISGVRDVESFDESGASLVTVSGRLTLEGAGIKINVLDLERGVVRIEGRIDALYYSDASEGEKKSFFGRVFR
ncbi:MAG: sporulation protein YabP [Clostridia bacterium]|nr:sporulation protein YabP [Clostridia bacterium]